MSIFNRIFRTRANISRVEICRYIPRHGLLSEKGVEIQLHHVVRGGNLPVILPLRVVKEIPGLWDENNRFSNELLSGCNLLLEIQKTSRYNRKRAEIKKRKKELAAAGIKSGGKRGRRELARAQNILSRRIKKQQMLKKRLAEKQKMMKKR